MQSNKEKWKGRDRRRGRQREGEKGLKGMDERRSEFSNGLTRRNDIRGTWPSSASRHRIYGAPMACMQAESVPPTKSPHSCGCPVPATDPLLFWCSW
jgi:hypothetical protein